jgi:hypothetical protein
MGPKTTIVDLKWIQLVDSFTESSLTQKSPHLNLNWGIYPTPLKVYKKGILESDMSPLSPRYTYRLYR